MLLFRILTLLHFTVEFPPIGRDRRLLPSGVASLHNTTTNLGEYASPYGADEKCRVTAPVRAITLYLVFRASYSHALANFQSRSTVRAEMPRNAAISSTLIAPKSRISTMRAAR